jgi:hypothetical protein
MCNQIMIKYNQLKCVNEYPGGFNKKLHILKKLSKCAVFWMELSINLMVKII